VRHQPKVFNLYVIQHVEENGVMVNAALAFFAPSFPFSSPSSRRRRKTAPATGLGEQEQDYSIPLLPVLFSSSSLPFSAAGVQSRG